MTSLYRYYLAADLAAKRLAAIGLKPDRINFDLDPSFRGNESENEQGVKYYMRWPEVRVDIDNSSFGFEGPVLWDSDARRLAEGDEAVLSR